MKNEAKILISSSTKNLSLLRDFVREFVEKMKVDENVINQIVLSVDEACTNIIKHAHNYNNEKNIGVTVSTDKDEFTIKFDYKGTEGFDPNRAEDPDMDEYFKSFKIGGLGIPIMKRFMNRIIAKHKSPDDNTLILVKSLNGITPSSAPPIPPPVPPKLAN
ncbi:hypothetical protein BH10BAC5_BH10BAC5_21750 [soil metagenome]